MFKKNEGLRVAIRPDAWQVNWGDPQGPYFPEAPPQIGIFGEGCVPKLQLNGCKFAVWFEPGLLARISELPAGAIGSGSSPITKNQSTIISIDYDVKYLDRLFMFVNLIEAPDLEVLIDLSEMNPKNFAVNSVWLNYVHGQFGY